MTELYRGLLLVLTEKFIDLISTLRMHIRLFRNTSSDTLLDVGVSGFWNFMLEVIFTLFAIGCLCAGILLTAGLAIFAYPLKAMLNMSAAVLKSIRNPLYEGQPEKLPPNFDDPVVSKKSNVKEK
jgi:hypothetical protein